MAEPVGTDRATGLSAGKQPRRGSLVSEDRPAVAVGNEALGEVGEGFGQDDGCRSEAESDCAVAGDDVIDAESADNGGPLGGEHEKQASDTVAGIESFVVQ